MKSEILERAIAITTVIGLLVLGMTVFSIAEDIFQERDARGHKQERQTNTREANEPDSAVVHGQRSGLSRNDFLSDEF